LLAWADVTLGQPAFEHARAHSVPQSAREDPDTVELAVHEPDELDAAHEHTQQA
jgi:hypothetical protein